MLIDRYGDQRQTRTLQSRKDRLTVAQIHFDVEMPTTGTMLPVSHNFDIRCGAVGCAGADTGFRFCFTRSPDPRRTSPSPTSSADNLSLRRSQEVCIEMQTLETREREAIPHSLNSCRNCADATGSELGSLPAASLSSERYHYSRDPAHRCVCRRNDRAGECCDHDVSDESTKAVVICIVCLLALK